MRIEKGHVTGAELNGQTTARDLGLGKMVSTKKDFIGRVMARRAALTAPDRPALVGFRPRRSGGACHPPARISSMSARPRRWRTISATSLRGLVALTESWIGLGPDEERAGSAQGETVRAWDGVRKPRHVDRAVRSPVSTIRKGSACVADGSTPTALAPSWPPRSAFAGIAIPAATAASMAPRRHHHRAHRASPSRIRDRPQGPPGGPR